MIQHKEKIVIDAGNTRIKVGVFQRDELMYLQIFDNENLSGLKSFLVGKKKCDCIISSVRSEKDTLWLKQMFDNSYIFKDFYRDVIQMDYETPQTLGMDRVVNVKAAYEMTKGNSLVVDIGTCIKFDLVNKEGIYLGGSISPGIKLRYKSMNDYTAALPLLNERSSADLIGKSTISCMHSGVMNGIKAEIDTFIDRYKQEIENLTVFITGGDCEYFDFKSKNNIFVNKNLSLWGLYLTLETYAH